MSTDLAPIRPPLAPYHASIEVVVVESTDHWDWLVDGLMEAGYRVHRANGDHPDGCRVKAHR